MGVYYTIKQGDHVSSVAKDAGFTDYLTIWNDPNNADLKKKRQNPNVLLPGDLLYLPDRDLKEESRGTEKRHKFVAHRPPLKLRLVLEDLFEKPIANAKCDLSMDGQLLKVTTDGKGQIEQPLRPEVHAALLTIKDSQTPFNNVEIPIKIGHLDPVDEVSGQVVRLNNLGYFAGDIAVSDPAQFESAVEEFQCDNGLTVDGKCGTGTQAKLKQVHGC